MKKTTICCSVRVRDFRIISDKAVLIETFDGRKDVFPLSQIYGVDRDGLKCDAYWISEWILEKKNIQWSKKKRMLVSNDDSGNIYHCPQFAGLVTYHNPEHIEPVESNEIESLRKPV